MGDVYPNGYPLQNPYQQPGGGSTAGGTAAPWYQQPWVYNAADLFLTAGSTYMGVQSAAAANRKNVQLQREQQAWEERMSNTAVQRRADDIEKAGGNRALAFTNGQSASSPTGSQATVQPTFNPAWLRGGGMQALALAAQVENTRANTAQQLATARITNVEADIREQLKDMEKGTRANTFVETQEWNDLKTKILRSQDIQSAAEADRIRRTVDSLVTQASNMAKAGKYDLDALANVAKVGGIEAGKMQWVLKLILDAVRVSKD